MNNIFIIIFTIGVLLLPSMVNAQDVAVEVPEEDLQMSLEQRREEWKMMSEEEKIARREALKEERLQRRAARKAIETDGVIIEGGEVTAVDIFAEAELEAVQEIIIEQPKAAKKIKTRGNWNKLSRPSFND